jgi:hypothetical protein
LTEFLKYYDQERENGGQAPSSKDLLQNLFDAIEADDFKSFETMFAEEYVNQLHPSELFDDDYSWTLLHCSCYYGRSRFIEFIMEKGANVEVEDTWYGGRPLAWATFGNHPKICRLLIDKYGANKYAKNKHGQTAFDLIQEKNAPQWKPFFQPDPVSKPVISRTPTVARSSTVTIKIPPQTDRPKPSQSFQTPIPTQRFVIPPAKPSTVRKVDPRARANFSAVYQTPQQIVLPPQTAFQSYLASPTLLPQELVVESISNFIFNDRSFW